MKTKPGWTAIGVTVDTKKRFSRMKTAFEKKLNQGSISWDYFFQAILDLGPLAWNFLIDEAVKSLQAVLKSCPLPTSSNNSSIEG